MKSENIQGVRLDLQGAAFRRDANKLFSFVC